MKIKSLVQNTVARFITSFVLGLGFAVVGMVTHSLAALNSPSFVLATFFWIQVTVMAITVMLYGDEEGHDTEKQLARERRLIAPVKIITAVILLTVATPVGQSDVYKLIVASLTVWLIFSGMFSTFQLLSPILDKRQDMRKVARTARLEESLLEDLADYLVGSGSSESGPTGNSKK